MKILKKCLLTSLLVMLLAVTGIGGLGEHAVLRTEAASAKAKKTARKKLESFYKNSKSLRKFGKKRAWYYDVTHDGKTDLIVRGTNMFSSDIGEYTICVYTYYKGKVKKIYSRTGSDVHAGGFINVHLYKKSGKYYLVSTEGEMFQGYGKLGYQVFRLTNTGKKKILKKEYAIGKTKPISESRIRTVAKHYRKYIKYKTLVTTMDTLAAS